MTAIDFSIKHRSWCCFGHDYDDEDPGNKNKSTFYEGDEEFKADTGSAVAAVAWKVCFYLSCFPMCYVCYVTRLGRKALELRLGEFSSTLTVIY